MTRPFVLGLTGSIGMGKSTTAQLFQDEGVPVWDADAAVHKLYSKNGPAIEQLSHVVPETIVDAAVDRQILSKAIADRPELLQKVEAIVHPLVAADRAAFLDMVEERIAVVDIPLLFETGAQEAVDAIVVVTTSAEEQRRRVMLRPGMTHEKFEYLLSRQVPDADKRAAADYIVETSTLQNARQQVRDILQDVKGKQSYHA